MTCPKTCADASNIEITQELLDKKALPWNEAVQFTQQLGEKRTIDGKDVAIVFAKNVTMDHAVPYLQCACDFHYEVTPEGHRLHRIDTLNCARKELWHAARRKEVADWYGGQGLSPKEIVFDIFESVTLRGEFLGQRHADIYVREIAEIMALLPSSVWGEEGCPFQENSPYYEKFFARMVANVISVNKMFLEGEHRLPKKEDIVISSLMHAYVLDIVHELYVEKRVELDGMVLVPYVPPAPEIPDESRTPMIAFESTEITDASPQLVWFARYKNRFQAEVQRINRTEAVLCLFNRKRTQHDMLLHTWRVWLAYGAQFGPDVDDVFAWSGLIDTFLSNSFPKPSSRVKRNPKKTKK